MHSPTPQSFSLALFLSLSLSLSLSWLTRQHTPLSRTSRLRAVEKRGNLRKKARERRVMGWVQAEGGVSCVAHLCASFFIFFAVVCVCVCACLVFSRSCFTRRTTGGWLVLSQSLLFLEELDDELNRLAGLFFEQLLCDFIEERGDACVAKCVCVCVCVRAYHVSSNTPCPPRSTLPLFISAEKSSDYSQAKSNQNTKEGLSATKPPVNTSGVCVCTGCTRRRRTRQTTPTKTRAQELRGEGGGRKLSGGEGGGGAALRLLIFSFLDCPHSHSRAKRVIEQKSFCHVRSEAR